MSQPAGVLPRMRSTASNVATARRAVTILVVIAPVLIVLVMGWHHRWISDDGFINLRVIDQIKHGNGPVFNGGERVEAFTSPLWIALLFVLDVVTPIRLEWLAVGAGLMLTAVAFGLAAAAAARVWRTLQGTGFVVPAGLLLMAALPATWDFATSGLDTALDLAWIAASWWALCRLICRSRDAPPRPEATPRWVCVLVGLGPLVRPDLSIMTVGFVVVLFVSETSLRRRLRVGAWALALPLAYQVFRMAYYAALVSNTALAKEAARSDWSRGWRYFLDFVQTYELWLPLALLAALGFVPIIRALRARASLELVVLVAAPIATGSVHALYVVAIGGDFMHARMLLPSLFCLLLPTAVVVVRAWAWVPTMVMVAWALICAVSLRTTATFTVDGISDERHYYVTASGVSNPVTIDDYLSGPGPLPWARAGKEARALAAHGNRVFVPDGFDPSHGRLRLSNPLVTEPVVAVVGNVGMYGYAAGPDVFVVDQLGLADPLAARVRLVGRGRRAGHEKALAPGWNQARFTAAAPHESPAVRAARRALRCGNVPELLAAVDGTFGPSPAWHNFWDSFTLTTLRVPSAPEQAARELCGVAKRRS